MSITHVVTLTFQTGTPQRIITELAAELDVLGGQVSATEFRHGHDLRIRDGNSDYVITAVFANEREFFRYMQFPLHQKIIRQLVVPDVASRSAVQFSTPSHRADGATVAAESIASHTGVRW